MFLLKTVFYFNSICNLLYFNLLLFFSAAGLHFVTDISNKLSEILYIIYFKIYKFILLNFY